MQNHIKPIYSDLPLLSIAQNDDAACKMLFDAGRLKRFMGQDLRSVNDNSQNRAESPL
jgi:hypothetical protein